MVVTLRFAAPLFPLPTSLLSSFSPLLVQVWAPVGAALGTVALPRSHPDCASPVARRTQLLRFLDLVPGSLLPGLVRPGSRGIVTTHTRYGAYEVLLLARLLERLL